MGESELSLSSLSGFPSLGEAKGPPAPPPVPAGAWGLRAAAAKVAAAAAAAAARSFDNDTTDKDTSKHAAEGSSSPVGECLKRIEGDTSNAATSNKAASCSNPSPPAPSPKSPSTCAEGPPLPEGDSSRSDKTGDPQQQQPQEPQQQQQQQQRPEERIEGGVVVSGSSRDSCSSVELNDVEEKREVEVCSLEGEDGDRDRDRDRGVDGGSSVGCGSGVCCIGNEIGGDDKESTEASLRDFFSPLSREQLLDLLSWAALRDRQVYLRCVERVHASPSSRRLMVRNIPFCTTDESFRAFFLSFGGVEDALIVRERDGQSRGYGFVTFSSSEGVSKCFFACPLILEGRQLHIKLAANALPSRQQTKLFVRNLHENTTAETLKQAFSCFGVLEECVVVRDAEGRSKGYGFLNFSSPLEAFKAVQMSERIIDGRVVFVHFAASSPSRGGGASNNAAAAATAAAAAAGGTTAAATAQTAAASAAAAAAAAHGGHRASSASSSAHEETLTQQRGGGGGGAGGPPPPGGPPPAGGPLSHQHPHTHKPHTPHYHRRAPLLGGPPSEAPVRGGPPGSAAGAANLSWGAHSGGPHRSPVRSIPSGWEGAPPSAAPRYEPRSRHRRHAAEHSRGPLGGGPLIGGPPVSQGRIGGGGRCLGGVGSSEGMVYGESAFRDIYGFSLSPFPFIPLPSPSMQLTDIETSLSAAAYAQLVSFPLGPFMPLPPDARQPYGSHTITK